MTLPRRLPNPPTPSRAEDADWNSEALTRVIPQATEPPARPPPLPATALFTPPVLPPVPVLGAPAIPQRTSQSVSVPPAVAASAAAVKASSSAVRRASYALVPLVLALFALSVYRRQAPASESPSGAQVPSASVAPMVSAAAPSARPVIETRTVDAPTAKQAASAFARGDYREALAQYRALARQQPDEVAYRSLIAILERRLTARSAE